MHKRGSKCGTCGKEFADDNRLKNHEVIHLAEKEYKCRHEGCNKSFHQPGLLEEHIRIHTGKLYKCEYDGCDKAFSTKDILKEHMMLHTGEERH